MAGATGQTEMANAIRALAMDAVEAAKSGHPGMPMGMADVATVLFGQVLRYDADAPNWRNRDRFVLSAGHGSMLLYSLLYLIGYPGISIEDLKAFRQLGAKTAGHPEFGHLPGVETTTGPLGQGIANAVGLAIGERIWNARLGDMIDYRTYVIAGDGCLMEGISQEAITLAGHLGLGKLIVLFDDNGISIDGATSLTTSEDQCGRFAAAGWNTLRVDGHDPDAVLTALETARADASRPTLIACRTVIGYGAPNKQGTAATHGAPLGKDEIAGARKMLGWAHEPFVVPKSVLDSWHAAGRRCSGERKAWETSWKSLPASQRAQFEDPLGGGVSQALDEAVSAAKSAVLRDGTEKATRVWSEMTLGYLTQAVPGMIGGSADLTGSNNTKAKTQKVILKSDFTGSYIHYGVREHGMAAAMNGLALTGGLIPYGGTFLVFTDYCRPSIRLSALMGQRVVYVMTHDSIGLGEDGPTHQPVEHLAALRAIPNLQVFRPCDGIETVECWQLAVCSEKTPSILALTRQAVPNIRKAGQENLSAQGGYVLREAEGQRDVTLLATGSEVGLALTAVELLKSAGINAAVVSMPSFELFRAQSQAYRAEVLGQVPRVAVEAGVVQGWHEWLGDNGRFVGMSGFGASAPAPQLYAYFGITPEAVAAAAREALS